MSLSSIALNFYNQYSHRKMLVACFWSTLSLTKGPHLCALCALCAFSPKIDKADQRRNMSDDFIWYNETAVVYAVSTATKRRCLVTYFIAVPGADKKFDPTESQQLYKFEVKVLFNLVQASCWVFSFKSTFKDCSISTAGRMPFLADSRFTTVFSINMIDVKEQILKRSHSLTKHI